jgi:signal transduction histidine kinase/CheY-like chemotaxis protein
VYFRELHRFSDRDTQLIDVIGRQAADLIVSRAQHERLARVNEELKTRTVELEGSQERLSRQADELLSEDRNREEFLAALGHELRNPLSAMVSSLALLRPSDERARRAGAVLRRQTAHMTRLVNDLLDITRVKHGKLRLEREPIELNQWIGFCLASIRPQAEAKRLTLKYVVPPEPITINADPERLAQVLDNLLRNALTHTDRGEIELLVERQASHARIAVRDTGIGIDPKDTPNLFKPYQQRDGGERAGGLGLGLTLVKALVEAHGGTVAVRSEGRGRGSEFSFTIPLASEAVSARPERGGAAPPGSRVLVVDDQRDIADMFGALLETLGQDVTVVYSGADALRAAGERLPQVAFIDLSMPEMTGVEVAHRLREEFPSSTMTLVAMTGHGKPGAAAASAFDDYLLKPVSKESVTAVLSHVSRDE